MWQRYGAAAYRIQDIRPYSIRTIKFSVLKFRVSRFANVNKRVATITVYVLYVFVSVSESWQEYRPELVSRAAWLIETSFIIVLEWFHWNWHINGTWTCNIRIVSLSVRLSLCRSVSLYLYWSGLHLYFSIYIHLSCFLYVCLPIILPVRLSRYPSSFLSLTLVATSIQLTQSISISISLKGFRVKLE